MPRLKPLPSALANTKRSHSRWEGAVSRAQEKVKCRCSHQVAVIATSTDGILDQTRDSPAPCTSSRSTTASTRKPIAPTIRKRAIWPVCRRISGRGLILLVSPSVSSAAREALTPRFAVRPPSLGTVLALVSFALIVVRATRTVDPYWDTLAYHWPYAARAAGLCDKDCFLLSFGTESRYDGFPLLLTALQG